MEQYNGHRSWNAWNVSLWISNDEPLYRVALKCIEEARRVCAKHGWSPKRLARIASCRFMLIMGNSKTPDGAVYNHLSVKLCLQGLLDD